MYMTKYDHIHNYKMAVNFKMAAIMDFFWHFDAVCSIVGRPHIVESFCMSNYAYAGQIIIPQLLSTDRS